MRVKLDVGPPNKIGKHDVSASVNGTEYPGVFNVYDDKEAIRWAKTVGVKFGLSDEEWAAIPDRLFSLADQETERLEQVETRRNKLGKYSAPKLFDEYRTMKTPVIDGLVRKGETANIVSVTKVGKSWLMYYILLSIATGKTLFDNYQSSLGRVLLIDNELHKPTLANRISTVGAAMGLLVDDYGDKLDVWPLRGNLRSLRELNTELLATAKGEYQAIAFDARYRFAVDGESENDNASQAMFYNELDRIAEHTDAALFLVHHSTKGSQTEKRITDVGAGAGAQSRAADSHLILREHEEEGHIVFDAAVRSFPPVKPMVLRWEFPLWVPTDEDPRLLKGVKTKGESRQDQRDKEATMKILGVLLTEPATASQVREHTGLSRDRAKRLLDILVSEGQIQSRDIKIRGNVCKQYHITDVDVVDY